MKNISNYSRGLSALSLCLLIMGCAATGKVSEQNLTSDNGLPSLDLKVQTKKESSVRGEIEMVQEEKRLKIVAKFKGLKPDSRHGFHIHEKGDCSSADFKSAGGHFNPEKNSHGAPSADEHHVGDLGNVVANKKGVAVFNQYFIEISITGNKLHNILGRSLVLHEFPDDFVSQPSGASGARIACAEIPSSL